MLQEDSDVDVLRLYGYALRTRATLQIDRSRVSLQVECYHLPPVTSCGLLYSPRVQSGFGVHRLAAVRTTAADTQL